MLVAETLAGKLLEIIVDHADIPKSYYIKAVERHKSLGKWLCRPASRVAKFRPNVSSQGSFRHGTVVLPVHANAKYDLDNVVTLEMGKGLMTQKHLKQLFGEEIKEYAEAHCMSSPVEETNRCWRLNYSDEAPFHLDTLPCICEEQDVIRLIISYGVPLQLAALSVAITDRRHPHYEQLSKALISSNPRGFAEWFEERTRTWALPRLRKLVEERLYKSVEEVPAYEWNTPLQRSIQILKRHRDVMFRDSQSMSPISMIITNLAAHAYGGESDLFSALTNILDGMPKYMNRTRPRVPNPADPAEDYAEKWVADPDLENNFWMWHMQVRADIARLPTILQGEGLFSDVQDIFGIDLSRDELNMFESFPSRRAPAVIRAASVISISAAPMPWGRNV